MSQDNIETMRNAYDAFARGDFSQLPFDRQIEWIEPDVEGFWSRGTHHGLEAVIKEVFEPTLERFDNFRVQCDQYLDAGQRVVVTGRFLGRGKDTGNELNAPLRTSGLCRTGKSRGSRTTPTPQTGFGRCTKYILISRSGRCNKAHLGYQTRIVPYADNSDTFSNIWKLRVIRPFRGFRCAVLI